MEDVQGLVKGLADIHKFLQAKLSVADASTATQIERRQQPQTSEFLQLPDSALMFVFSFLDFVTEVPQVVETCHRFSVILRSTQFQYFLYQKPTVRPAPVRAKTLPVSSGVEVTPDSDLSLTKAEEDQLSKEEASKRLQKANKIKEVLAGKIIRQEKIIEGLTKDLDTITKEIMTEKLSNSKNLSRVAELQREYEKYKTEIETSQLKLKEMHTKHAAQVQELQTQISKLQTDIKELEDHKRMLRSEVLRLRDEGATTNKEIESYRSALNKMKKYFDAMFPAEVKKQ